MSDQTGTSKMNREGSVTLRRYSITRAEQRMSRNLHKMVENRRIERRPHASKARRLPLSEFSNKIVGVYARTRGTFRWPLNYLTAVGLRRIRAKMVGKAGFAPAVSSFRKKREQLDFPTSRLKFCRHYLTAR